MIKNIGLKVMSSRYCSRGDDEKGEGGVGESELRVREFILLSSTDTLAMQFRRGIKIVHRLLGFAFFPQEQPLSCL